VADTGQSRTPETFRDENMMRIGYCADATATACWWVEEIDGLMTSAEKGSDRNQREVMTDVWLLVDVADGVIPK
jgi:hypothetical protein